ncbi:hypothetical protein BBJ28_00015971, partial [Nothophytophthora sp. Chile5]
MADAAPPAPKKLTKKELRVLERQKAAVRAAAAEPKLTDTYGEKPLIQSQERPGNVYKSYVAVDGEYRAVAALHPELQGESFWVRGHLQSVRAKSKIAFLTLREQTATIQAILHESDEVTKPMIKFAAGV